MVAIAWNRHCVDRWECPGSLSVILIKTLTYREQTLCLVAVYPTLKEIDLQFLRKLLTCCCRKRTLIYLQIETSIVFAEVRALPMRTGVKDQELKFFAMWMECLLILVLGIPSKICVAWRDVLLFLIWWMWNELSIEKWNRLSDSKQAWMPDLCIRNYKRCIIRLSSLLLRIIILMQASKTRTIKEWQCLSYRTSDLKSLDDT